MLSPIEEIILEEWDVLPRRIRERLSDAVDLILCADKDCCYHMFPKRDIENKPRRFRTYPWK
jgi:hypothetical protein